MLRRSLPALLLVVAVPAVSHGDEWNKTYPIQDRASVRLDTSDGSVDVETWDRPEVQVHIVTEGYKISPKEVRVTDESAGDHVQVTVREPWFEFHLGLTGHRRSIKLTVRMPRQADLSIHTGDGAVKLAPLAGKISVESGDGAIHAEGLSGDVSLVTADGPVQATGLTGRLVVETGDGRVQVEGKFEELSIQTGDGPITAECENGSTLGTGWDIRSGDGDITLRVGSDLSANLDARTGDGHVTLDLPIVLERTHDRYRLRGALNGGGPPLKAVSSDGSIRIEKL